MDKGGFEVKVEFFIISEPPRKRHAFDGWGLWFAAAYLFIF